MRVDSGGSLPGLRGGALSHQPHRMMDTPREYEVEFRERLPDGTIETIHTVEPAYSAKDAAEQVEIQSTATIKLNGEAKRADRFVDVMSVRPAAPTTPTLTYAGNSDADS